jgi:hypothetical protein
MKMFHYLTVIFAVLTISIYAQSGNSEEIEIKELKDHIGYLASDELEGRKPGTEGIEKAAEYIVEQLELLDVTPLGDDYFQVFEIVKDLKAGDDNSLEFDDFEGTIGIDYTPSPISSSDELEADVVFVGYGFNIDEDSLKWNDYAGINVENKWVMILRGAPSAGGHSDPYQDYSSLRKKVLTARDNKAGGVIFVSGKEFDDADELMELSYNSRETAAGLPIVHVKRSVADNMLSKQSVTIEDLEKQLTAEKNLKSFDLGVTASIETDIIKITEETKNVIALLEGNDSELKNEYVLIGAHYDHLGYGGPGSGSRTPDTSAIHNGADDNASGTTAAIEIFERLANHRDELKRSVIFMAFSAEEMGLIGSKYFTNNPLVELNNIKFMINLDMVGRLHPEEKDLTIGGVGTAVGLEDMVNTYADFTDLNIKTSKEGYGPSDHASFYAKDISVMFVFTGIHEDYHTPADDPNTINYEGEKQVADLVYSIAFDIINLPEALAYQEAGPKQSMSSGRRFKVTLGIMPDVAGGNGDGVTADAVIEGRPAYFAGMQKGDRIVALDGKEVKDIYDYMNRLSGFKQGQRINVDVIRGDKKVILIVDL